uniref:Uncharacterized protein n=1 Tax=Timema genevievae TaxID=629358 RepID=A0A7R9K1G9_TIMGE|nr:unnamed protein product [Timema genevievae]
MEEFNTERFIDEPFMVVKELKLPIDMKLNQEPDVKDSATVLILAFKEAFMKRASSLSVLSGHNTEQGFMDYVLCLQHVRSNVASLRGRTASTEQLLLQNATDQVAAAKSVIVKSCCMMVVLRLFYVVVMKLMITFIAKRKIKIMKKRLLDKLKQNTKTSEHQENDDDDISAISNRVHLKPCSTLSRFLAFGERQDAILLRLTLNVATILSHLNLEEELTSLTIPTTRGLLYSCLWMWHGARAANGSSIYRQFTGTPEPYQPRPVIM